MASGELTGKRILVGVCGGIAAYKVCTLVSRLAQQGCEVTVAMTESAARFVGELTFQALSGRAVYTGPFEHIENQDPQHVALAGELDCAVVAPCTMDMLARLSHGNASDTVSLILGAIDRSKTPVLLAPSMNAQMWAQASTRRNVETLRADGFEFVGPGVGWQACRTVGEGRMSEPDDILQRIIALLRDGTGC